MSAHRKRPERLSTQPNEAWSMDFVHDRFEDGGKLRFLTMIDVHTRQCLAIAAQPRLTAIDVVSTLDTVLKQIGKPKRIFCDNGSEFQSRLVDLWAYKHAVTLEFSRPGTPTDNAYIESFNGSFRDECLNTHWCAGLQDAKLKVEAWRKDYNANRPHRALSNLTPN